MKSFRLIIADMNLTRPSWMRHLHKGTERLRCCKKSMIKKCERKDDNEKTCISEMDSKIFCTLNGSDCRCW